MSNRASMMQSYCLVGEPTLLELLIPGLEVLIGTPRDGKDTTHTEFILHIFTGEIQKWISKTDGSTDDINFCLRHRWSSQI